MKGTTIVLIFLSACLSAEASKLPVNGSHTYRHLGFIHVFDAILHLPENYTTPFFDPTKSIELVFNYYRPISSEQLIEQADKSLKRIHRAEDGERFAAELAKINAAYLDVDRGDSYRLTYHPEIGTTLYLNGEELVKIEGADFPAYYFSIWLGKEDSQSKMARNLWADLASIEQQ